MLYRRLNILLLLPVSASTGEKPASGSDLASLGIYTIMVVVILGLLMFLATWLGRKRHTSEKDRPYESGVIPTGPARLRVPVQFYLVAIFFIIFDLEAVFLHLTGKALRD